MFQIVQRAFNFPSELILDVRAIDSVSPALLEGAGEVAALLLRKLQLLHLVCQDGYLTTNQSVILLLSDILNRFKLLKEELGSGSNQELQRYLNRLALALTTVGEQDTGGGVSYLR